MTSQAQPETIFNSALERAMDLLVSRSSSEIQFKRVERDAETLARIDRAGAFEIRGHIAAARGDFPAADDWFNKALNITSDYQGSVIRYLVVLGASNQVEKLGPVFERLRGGILDEPEALRIAKRVLAGAGWLEKAAGVTSILERMKVDCGSLPATLGERSAFNSCNFDGIEETDLVAAVGFCRRFLAKRNANPEMVQSMVVPFEDGTSAAMFQMFVDQSVDEAAELEMELFEALESSQLKADAERKIVFVIASSRGMDVS